MPRKPRKHVRLSEIAAERKKTKRDKIETDQRERLQWELKQHAHKPSMTFMSTKKLQDLINNFLCPKCNQKGTQLVHQRSMKGVNTNLEIICSCESNLKSWTAADEFTDAFLLSAKVNGITRTQLERQLICLNFTVESESLGTSVCFSSNAMQKKIRDINSKLIDLKEKIEKAELDRILEERPDVFIASEDGAYPNGVRTRNSGACFNTVMAYDKTNKAKIVCKYYIDRSFDF